MPALVYFTSTLVSASLVWLFVDALKVRFEEKTFLKALGFGILTLVNAFKLMVFLNAATEPQFMNSPLTLWITSLAYMAIFLSFVLDEHVHFQIGIILPVIVLLFLRGHWQLTALSFVTALIVLQLSYTTKHRDLIPFGIGFILITIAEFFLSTNGEELGFAATLLYLFAQGALLFWWWSYVAIRFSINSLGPRLKV